MSNKQTLTVANHLERDPRLDGWSVHGLGSHSHTTEQWVAFLLSFELGHKLPDDLQEMYRRAQACMVYGCYHYPLFTMGSEELLRFLESTLKAALLAFDAPRKVLKSAFSQQIDWACANGLMDNTTAERWHAVRQLRNRASHKDDNMIVGPNHALMDLKLAKDFAEDIFSAAGISRGDQCS